MNAKLLIIAVVLELDDNESVYTNGAVVESYENDGAVVESSDEDSAPPTIREGIPRTLRGLGPTPEVDHGR